MGPTRRAVLGGLGGLGGLVACGGRAPPPLTGSLLGGALAEAGHRVRRTFTPPAAREAEPVDVLIIGGGVAGLSAGWRLARAGFQGRALLLELGEAPGGTAASGDGPLGPYALGAHYLTLPNPECTHVRALLAELGVIQRFDAEGRPVYDPFALCLAPEERLFVHGEWIDGLWPEGVASPEDVAQRDAFLALCARLRDTRGADDQPVFSIPVARSSADPAWRALAQVSFADWLDAQGFTAPVLRWWLRYATRDDFGAELHAVSAWAGLHYHCARRPDPGDAEDLGTHVLTWPAGNGWLVAQLRARFPGEIRCDAVALQIEPGLARSRVWYAQGDQVAAIDARQVIAAVPARVLDRLLDRDRQAPRPDLAPWRVAALFCDRPPASRGVPLAWDSVVYGGEGLGYVSSAHQTGAYGGPTVLSWYSPDSGRPPAEARQALLDSTWEAEVERVFADLAPAHPDLRARVSRIDVARWGHGTVIPAVGLHAPGALDSLAAPIGAVHPAHTDLSGLSLFEEASWHGVRAAEAALTALALDPGPLLAGAT